LLLSSSHQLADGGRAVEIGTDRVYGAMQQFGGTKAQHPQLWGTIPARPFLGLSDTDRDGVLAILSRYLSAGL
jgi:phage gpG-like protein